jgi:uncharacterized membrane protein HdeD (DUF308 family)
MIVPPLASLPSPSFLGWMFLISGIAGLALTFWARQMPGFWWSLISAALAVGAGIILLAQAGAGHADAHHRGRRLFPRRGRRHHHVCAGASPRIVRALGLAADPAGIMDILIAGIIIAGLPGSAEWAIGLLVGINCCSAARP